MLIFSTWPAYITILEQIARHRLRNVLIILSVLVPKCHKFAGLPCTKSTDLGQGESGARLQTRITSKI